jgi:pimeloyl-ACP methyl ester carboxylesterase
VVRGELSPILTRPMAERLRAEISGARLVEIPGAYHHLVLDRPEAFVAEVRGFLDDLDARATAGAATSRRASAS